jgi:hypothetical protein
MLNCNLNDKARNHASACTILSTACFKQINEKEEAMLPSIEASVAPAAAAEAKEDSNDDDNIPILHQVLFEPSLVSLSPLLPGSC